MTDIRGIHYEIPKPVRNDTDGYWYQRRRQVDGQGNLVGIGDQLIKLPNQGSKDGQYEPGLDWVKIGKLGGDAGQVGYGIIRRDAGAAARGAMSFARDIRDGLHEDYRSWPGTDRPWEGGDIPAPSPSGDNTPPNSGSAQPLSSPHSENVPERRLVRLTSASPTASTTVPSDSAPSANGGGDAATPSISAPQDPEEPLSINAAYLLYLKRLSASQAQ